MTNLNEPTSFNFGDVGFLLEQAVKSIPHVRGVILLTADGLLRAKTKDLAAATAERMAAACTGLQSTSRGTGEFIDPAQDVAAGWRRLVVEFEQGYVLIVAADHGSFLAVATSDQADLGQVASWSQKLVASVGDHLAAQVRQDAGNRS